jgi:hypothetical protein
MADVTGPSTCGACGRRLAPQHGRGRQRRYCDATCRSAARRRREQGSTQRPPAVKDSLTIVPRQGKLDAVGSADLADPVALRVRETAGRLLGELARGDAGSPLDVIAAARDLAAAANDALQEAVDRTRDAGRSWREIGEVLGTTRQAAFQRFGRPVDPRTGTPLNREVPPGSAEHAVALVTCLTQGRWDDVVSEFGERMRERVDAERLASGWVHTVGMIGSFERIGEPFAHQAGDDVMVSIPLHFEAGDAVGSVRFSSDGKVAGLMLRPAPPPG